MNGSIREEFIGDVVRHTTGGTVHCNAEPEFGKVLYDHQCLEEMERGDGVIIYYEKDHLRDDEDWFQKFRFCWNCEPARKLPPEGRKRGIEQAVVEGTLEKFEGVVEGKFYDDAVRLTDVNVLHYSEEFEDEY